MGGLVIETVRDGVQFTPEAADAFRRADAQVQRELGRPIDVNSTYRSWSDQMLMFTNWNLFIAGKGPYPGHSKAAHPSESFHVSGLALDSDDWTVPRIVEILAQHGFIRNRLYVDNEEHHFEYIRERDNHKNETPAGKVIRVVSQGGHMESVKVKWDAKTSHIYGVDTGALTHHATVKQATITRNVMSALDEEHQLSKADFMELLDGLIIPRTAVNKSGQVLNPETGVYAWNGAWTWERKVLGKIADVEKRLVAKG